MNPSAREIGNLKVLFYFIFKIRHIATLNYMKFFIVRNKGISHVLCIGEYRFPQFQVNCFSFITQILHDESEEFRLNKGL